MGYKMNILSGSKAAGDGVFVEDPIELPKAAGGNLPAIIGIEVLHMDQSVLATKYSRWALCDKSNDAIPDLDDSEVIASGWRQAGENGAAGQDTFQDLVERVYFPAPVPIRTSRVYFQAVQNSGSSHTYRYRILWTNYYVQGARQEDAISQKTQF